MSEIKNGGLDQYGVEPFKQQQFGTAGIERVNNNSSAQWDMADCDLCAIKTPMPKNLPQPVTSIKDLCIILGANLSTGSLGRCIKQKHACDFCLYNFGVHQIRPPDGF